LIWIKENFSDDSQRGIWEFKSILRKETINSIKMQAILTLLKITHESQNKQTQYIWGRTYLYSPYKGNPHPRLPPGPEKIGPQNLQNVLGGKSVNEVTHSS